MQPAKRLQLELIGAQEADDEAAVTTPCCQTATPGASQRKGRVTSSPDCLASVTAMDTPKDYEATNSAAAAP